MESNTIVIQGRIDQNLTNKFSSYLQYGKVILSTWEGENTDNVDDKISIIKTKVEKLAYNRANIFYQVLSTLNGLNQVTTKNVIKVRADEHYENLLPVINKMVEGKMITSNVFFRRDSYKKFAASDHIMAGDTERMKTLFYNAYCKLIEFTGKPEADHKLANSNYLTAEVLLTTEWIKQFEKIDDNRSKELMKKYIDVVDVNSLGQHIVKWNHLNKAFTSFSDIDSISDINQL